MKFQSTIMCFFIALSIFALYGCAGLQGFYTQQKLNDNYALTEWEQVNENVIIDPAFEMEDSDVLVQKQDPTWALALWTLIIVAPIVIIILTR